MRSARIVVLFVLLASSLLFVSPTFSQTSFGFVNNITAVPVPGVGHDYLHDLDEMDPHDRNRLHRDEGRDDGRNRSQHAPHRKGLRARRI